MYILRLDSTCRAPRWQRVGSTVIAELHVEAGRDGEGPRRRKAARTRRAVVGNNVNSVALATTDRTLAGLAHDTRRASFADAEVEARAESDARALVQTHTALAFDFSLDTDGGLGFRARSGFLPALLGLLQGEVGT